MNKPLVDGLPDHLLVNDGDIIQVQAGMHAPGMLMWCVLVEYPRMFQCGGFRQYRVEVFAFLDTKDPEAVSEYLKMAKHLQVRLAASEYELSHFGGFGRTGANVPDL